MTISEYSSGPILGIWDGHDAGAAIINGRDILFAVNEERLSRRKLDIGFPVKSIQAVMDGVGISAGDLQCVAVSTCDFAKTLTRLAPGLKEQYYQIRRRKTPFRPQTRLKKQLKYKLTEIPPTLFSRKLSFWALRRELSKIGMSKVPLELYEHHTAHAASAAFCSGFPECLVVTMDGIGDALSGSFWSFDGKSCRPLGTVPGTASFGIFFEHVTNLMNMRELEDEGKVMALANFAYPVPDSDNPLLGFLTVDGTNVRFSYSGARLYRELEGVLWQYSNEQFAFMAQRVLELRIIELIGNVFDESGHTYLAYTGGVASNVKVNMLIREKIPAEDLFIFPHMGDGGLALGAAMWANFRLNRVTRYELKDIFLGPDYSENAVLEQAKKFPRIELTRCDDVAEAAADSIAQGDIVMWFQGRMEMGPRSLGARSILARADSEEIKNELNLRLKRRVWYQPFCPTMLHADALDILDAYHGLPSPFMTSAYRIRKEKRHLVKGIVNIDGSCRPQIIAPDETTPYSRLLEAVKKRTGLGVILNTSFNLHGEPVVCSPHDAFLTFNRTDIDHLFIGPFCATKKVDA